MKALDFFKFASKDKNRLFMTGVYHDGGYKIATDARILVMAKADYPAENEGVLLDKAGEEIFDVDEKGKKYKAVFPKYKRAIPDLSEMHVTDFDFKQVQADLKATNALLKIHNKVTVSLVCYMLPNESIFSSYIVQQIVHFCECFPDAVLYSPESDCKNCRASVLVYVGEGTLENPDALCVFMPCSAIDFTFIKNGFMFFIEHYRDDVGSILRAMKKYDVLRRIRENKLTDNDKKLLANVQKYLTLAFPYNTINADALSA